MAQLGKQPPRYRFFLNPYKDVRFTRCPQCDNKTRQRKLPLFVHVDPMQPLLLNNTNSRSVGEFSLKGCWLASDVRTI